MLTMYKVVKKDELKLKRNPRKYLLSYHRT